MNTILTLFGFAIGSYFFPKLKKKAEFLSQKLGAQKRRINSNENHIIGFSILYFIIQKINQSRIQKNTTYAEFNLTGVKQMLQFPKKNFKYIEYFKFNIISFSIEVITGDNPYEFIYEIYGINIQDRMIEILETYIARITLHEKNHITIPTFFYTNNWLLTPNTYSLNENDNINILMQKNAVDYCKSNNVHSILLYGEKSNGKSFTVNFLSLNLSKAIYILNIFLQKEELIESIEKIPEDSIILVEDIDRRFKYDEKILEIYLNKILELSGENLVIFVTKRVDLYLGYNSIFCDNKIKALFKFD